MRASTSRRQREREKQSREPDRSQAPEIMTCAERFYLFIHERHTEREAETQAEGEADSSQGAQSGIRYWIPGSHSEPDPTEPPRHSSMKTILKREK